MDVKQIDQMLSEECIDSETGEIIDEERYNDLMELRQHVIEEKAMKVKRLKNDVEGYRGAKQVYENMINIALSKIESLRNELMIDLNGEKLSTAKVNISYKPSEKVVVDDISKLPQQYIRYKEPEVKKSDIKKALKNGEVFEGVRLVGSTSIVIK